MAKTRNVTLDEHDRKLLNLLQRDTTATAEILGSKIGLSASSIQRRIKRLRATGVIAREVAILNPDAVGKRMMHTNFAPKLRQMVLSLACRFAYILG